MPKLHAIKTRFLLICLSFFLILGCNQSVEESSQLKIITSFYPLSELAGSIGGEFVSVTLLNPPGSDPHDFEITPNTLKEMEEADLIILQGSGLETWFNQNLHQNLLKKGIPILILSEHLSTSNHENTEEFPEGEHEDPHTWLDPNLAILMTIAIKEELISIDPSHTENYEMGASAVIKTLEDLDKKYQEGFAHCELNQAIVSHNAFSYLGESYGIEFISIHGLSTEEEPSASDLEKIIEIAESIGTDYLLVEPGTNSSFIEVVSEEANLMPLFLDPMESPTGETGSDFFEIMEHNLSALKQSLKCQ